MPVIEQAQAQGDSPILLCRVKNPGINAPLVPLGWDLYIARRQREDGLLWLVCPSPGGRVPSETIDLIRRKIALSETKNPGQLYSWHEFDGKFEGLICPLAEGEQIAPYLRSRETVPLSTGYSLLRLMVAEIARWADSPELLESVRAGDFLVSLSYGVKVRIVLSLGFSFLREPRVSDDSALQWHCLSLVSELYRAMNRAEGTSSPGADRNKLEKPFQKLERRWRAGKWKGIEPVLGEVDKLLQKMEIAESKREKPESNALLFATRPEIRPEGMVARFLAGGFRNSYPDHLADSKGQSNSRPFSPYVLLGRNPQAKPAESLRYVYLLPPEDWLVDGFVNEVNQKLIHPFLACFEGTTRFRAVYSEERFTAVVGDPEKGIPVPLYSYLVAVQPEQVIEILRRLSRIFDVMDSEGVKIQLSTPWQLQLHRVGQENPKGNNHLAWNQSLDKWPAWSLKIRTEIPTEHLIAEPSGICWKWIHEKLDHKFLPALASWLLSLPEIRNDDSTVRIQTRGFHSIPEIHALFESTRLHLKEGVAEHRHRFIDLLEEGLRITAAQPR